MTTRYVHHTRKSWFGGYRWFVTAIEDDGKSSKEVSQGVEPTYDKAYRKGFAEARRYHKEHSS